ncbi:MAG: oligosaccharide flippase family protein [Verrucomicrobia bacterium]|jgi:O-antigen/teichoic acid export membrane protein|nr:oligosaccharide flippase family protein [Verrucomicrobiota bacterium]
MKRSRRIVLNTASNIALQCVGVAVSFFMMPLVLRYFGKEIFGVNAYVASIVLLFTFVSSAISMSLMKFIPESLAKGDYETFNRYLSATLSVSFCVNVLVALLIGTFPMYGIRLFGIPPHLEELTRRVFVVMSIATLLQFPVPVINGIYYGLEKFVLRNLLQMLSVAINVLAYIVVASQEGSLVHYVMVMQGGVIITMLMATVFILPRLPCALRWVPPSWPLLKQTLSLNLYLISNQAADTLLYSTDKMILQKLMGATAVADYHIARRTQSMAHAAISLPLSAIVPSLSAAYASGDTAYIRRMNDVGSFLYAALLVPLLATLFCLYDGFIQLWVGPGFEHIVFPGRLFLLTVVMALPFKVFTHCLVAHARVKELGIAKVSYAVLNVPLSIFLASRIGLVGVVIPTVCYWLVVYPVVVGCLAWQQKAMKGILVSFGIAVCSLLLAWVIRGAAFPALPACWSEFIVKGAGIFVVLCCLYAGVAHVCFRRGIRELVSRRTSGRTDQEA